MPRPGELAAVARRAAEIIQQRGKATGVAEDDHGRVCPLGALQIAAQQMTGDAIGPPDILFAMWRRVGVVSKWSDLPTTTEQDIAAMFLQVADDVKVIDA